MIDNLIIGSGPAGVATAKALLAQGRSVTMIDGGRELQAHDAALQERLRATAPEAWQPGDAEAWQAPQFSTPPGQVRRYGSDAAMELPETLMDPASSSVGLRHNFVKGGFSQVWGAAVRPYSQSDMSGWPVSAKGMAPHYRAVAKFVPIAGPQTDELPSHPGPGPVPQAKALLHRFPTTSDVHLRAATTAVHEGCRRCGLCLHGCPTDHIWKASQTVEEMQGNAQFTYHNGPAVVAVVQDGDHVTVNCADGTQIKTRRLFMGAGVLQTAKLLLQMGHVDSLTLRDSQFAFLPMLHAFRAPGTGQMPLTTLPQFFADIEIDGQRTHPAHAQIYAWNEFYIRDLMQNYSMGLPGARLALNQMARRMLVAQIFLHSDLGAQISLRLGQGGRLLARSGDNPAFAPAMQAAQIAFSKAARRAGAYALRFAARGAEPGASFHVGASVPMACEPSNTQTDILGRLAGQGRIHVIDASVLPAIPAATITLSVMANAHRIGTEAAKLD